MRTLALALTVGLLAGGLVPAAAAQPQLEVVDSPDVVVANDPETMADDPETDEREFNPEYVFSATVRANNDGDQRRVQAEGIVYADQDVEDECPQDQQAFPVAFVFKQLNLTAGEQVRFGGSTDKSQAQGEAYWPMALSQTYHNAQTGQNVSIEEGEHTFCAALRATGEDPACDRPDDETCVIARAPFTSYVRRTNQAPHITSMSVSPDNPRPGQRALFEAQAIDNSTQPRPDELSFTWRFDRGTQQGANVQQSFPDDGVYEATLAVSDGFDTVERTLRVPVGNATLDEDGSGTNDSPSLAVASIVAALAGGTVVARRRR
jgi:hypothetical protein